MPHTKTIEYSVTNRLPGIEVNISKPTFGEHYYEQLYRYPRIGVGYFRCSFRDKKIFGTAHGFYPYMNIPIIRKNTFLLNYHIAFGFSYLEKTFDVRKNNLNVAIGSHENIFFNLNIDARIKIFKHHELVHAIGITHFSNGNIKMPNLGLNYVSYSAGLNFNLDPTERTYKRIDLPSKKNKYEWNFIFSLGWRTFNLSHNDLEFASSLSTNLGRFINHKRKVGLGADIFYNEILKYEISPEAYEGIKTIEKTQYGLYVFHDLIYRRLSLVIHLGYYVYTTYKPKPIYTRFGLKYRLTRFLLANLSLKTHYANADFIEFGLGYYFRR